MRRNGSHDASLQGISSATRSSNTDTRSSGSDCLANSCFSLRFASSLIVSAPGDNTDLGEQVTELAVIDLHAVVEVEGDLLVGDMTELFVEGV